MTPFAPDALLTFSARFLTESAIDAPLATRWKHPARFEWLNVSALSVLNKKLFNINRMTPTRLPLKLSLYGTMRGEGG